MPKLIQIEDVKLKSMSVEIRAMTVSGKQMTLAIFRQLPGRSIWDADFRLLGAPWGRVLYFWGGDKDCTGFQVVWQDGKELFRSVHWKPELSYHSEVRKLERRLGEMRKAVDGGYARYGEVSDMLALRLQEERDAFERHERAYAELENLPQLFIAM